MYYLYFELLVLEKSSPKSVMHYLHTELLVEENTVPLSVQGSTEKYVYCTIVKNKKVIWDHMHEQQLKSR